MFKKLLFIYVQIIFLNFAYSQNGIGLKEKEYILNKKSSDKISLLIKGDKEIVESAVRKNNAFIKYSYNNIFAIDILKQNLNSFTKDIENIKIEIPIGKGTLLMDTALKMNNVENVHLGVSPLIQNYKGTNVIVGILDSGIHFDHQDFKNTDGTTRIRYIWDQNITASGSSISPLPYNYGAEWSWIDINNGSCNHIEPASQNGHGTTVAGAACGNGSASGYFTGVAPESEIIAVAVDYYDQDFLMNVVDAVDYVFKKADALGKPCVINISLGTYFGSHDGKDLAAQMIDALIEEKEGRVVVAASGNGNNIGDVSSSYISTHLSYDVTNDTSFTWFQIIPSEGKVYFDLWADISNFKNVSFAFQNDNPTNFTEYGKTNFLSIEDNFNVNLLGGVYHTEFVFDENAQSFGKVEYYIEEIEGRYHLEFLITPDSLNHIWRFMTTGTGKFDVWSSATYQGTSNMVKDLPPSFVVPDIVNYKLADNNKNIVSSFQCSDKVITVGNYSLRHHYFDVDSTYHLTGETPGEIFYSSSQGPTRDERLKPDISASGNITFSTGNMNFINLALAVNRQKVSWDTLHQRNGGTSIASPIVAGAVALYLEKNPNAQWYEVKEALKISAKKDVFTGTIANNFYGNGKLDAFSLLQFDAIVGCMNPTAFNYNINANVDDGSCIEIVYGCIDENALNYNQNANTDDGSCIEIIYGCTDSTANNFNANANVDDGTCDFSVGIEDIIVEGIFFTENPVITKSTLYYNYPEGKADVKFYNIIGKLILKKQVDSRNALIINAKDFETGVYYLNIQGEKNNVNETLKIIIR